VRRVILLAALGVFGVVVSGQVEAQNVFGAPTITSIEEKTNTLTLSWRAPEDNGGSPIVAYDVRHILSSMMDRADDNWTVEEDIWTKGTRSLEHDVKGLSDGLSYDLQVRAVNGYSNGPWSTVFRAETTDFGGSVETATELTLDAVQFGAIGNSDDEDIFRIVLAEETDLWVYASGPLETRGVFLDWDGTVLEGNEDGVSLGIRRGVGLRGVLGPGIYYVRVSSFQAPEVGLYTIHARSVTDPGNNILAALPITTDSVTPGRIGPDGGVVGDQDFYRLELTGVTDIWVMSFGDLDTVGTLLNSDGHFLGVNDDSGVLDNHLGFMIRRQLSAGTYYIGVRGFGVQDTGAYNLQVRTAAAPGSRPATAEPIELSVPEAGHISTANDVDYFSLKLAVDTYVFIYALSFSGGQLPLVPTVLTEQGAIIPMHVTAHENWVEQGQPLVSFSIWGRLEAGTHYLQVRPSGSATGLYLLDPWVSPYGRMLESCTAIATPQSDPLYGCQWHLKNTGQFEGGAMQDINVESVWASGNWGAGINVVVVDDGFEFSHEDLSENVLVARNHDYVGQGSVYNPLETHGTAVAGIIAARDNEIGVRGVAPRANIFSYNLIASGSSFSDNEADAMYRSEDAQHTAVSNNSWGFVETGMPNSAQATWELAVRRGVMEGYGGKGIFYVWAAGNGHWANDNSNLDGRANFFAVTASCAVGYDDIRSSYSEMGANLWVCGPSSSGVERLPSIATTDSPDRYRDSFGGTSAAAPVVSGAAALVRAANDNLTWRDVKLILAGSARQNDPANGSWEEGAPKYASSSERYSFSHEYGFGMVDVAAAVALAEGWTNLPAFRDVEAVSSQLDIALPDFPSTTISELTLDSHVQFVEFVEVNIALQHEFFRDLQIELVSPIGTISVLTVPSARVYSWTGSFDGTHRFGSARHLGENAAGVWTLRIRDSQAGDTGVLRSWGVKAYGHGTTPGYVATKFLVRGVGTLTVGWEPTDDIGGSVVTSYDLRYIPASATDGSWTLLRNVGANGVLSHTVRGLEQGMKYLVSVRAVNEAGPGPWAPPVSK